MKEGENNEIQECYGQSVESCNCICFHPLQLQARRSKCFSRSPRGRRSVVFSSYPSYVSFSCGRCRWTLSSHKMGKIHPLIILILLPSFFFPSLFTEQCHPFVEESDTKILLNFVINFIDLPHGVGLTSNKNYQLLPNDIAMCFSFFVFVILIMS